jgi:uncharacterized membrane protein YkoI
MNPRTLPVRKALAGLSLVAAGLVTGATLAVFGTASAADPTPTASAAAGTADRPAETALTGDSLAEVKAAVLARYAGATIDRIETDADGVYEAHITTADGGRATVEVDKSFAVTGTEAGRGRGGHGPGGGGGGAGETALTSDSLAKVKAAVLAKYAGATLERIETDNDGVYEAHITTAAGDRVTVELDKAYAVTGTE